MYSVIIIDDEEIIVEGLKKIIDWEKFGCTVVACGSDGVEGLELVKKFSPDIIFTDIKMPNKDGLEMLAQIKEILPNTQVTVLTGFRNFDYAREAIKIGVTRFLLKPSKMDELNEALSTMVANLSEQSKPPSLSTQIVKDGEQDDDLASSFIVRNAIKYIELHYSDKLTLGQVAEKNYVSLWHLSKLIKKHTDQSFSDILNNIRITNAKELLKNPSLKIYEVAENVGFSDMTHFSKTFKKIVGMTPNEYRNAEIK